MDTFIQNIMQDWVHQAIAASIVVLAIFFVYQIFLEGIWLIFKLGSIRRRVHALADHDPADITAKITQVFSKTRWLDQWMEYRETLHDQFDDSQPERRVISVRSTTTADSYFGSEVLVDAPLHTEFYKHLPGILTGIGIIATFFGLITGLQSFDVTATDPDAMKESLSGLFGHVKGAFTFSAIAIFLAMVFTIIEKVIYAICLRQAAGIALEVDRMFRAGVGEEYLSKLVHSSEEGATQTKQLKESLVEDLKILLTNLTERQIQATQSLSVDLGDRIQQSLQSPLQQIADSVTTVTRGQADQSAKILEDLMASFLAQMRESVGGQLNGLAEMMQQTSRAMGQVEGALSGLVSDMDRASQASSVGIQDAMQKLLASLAEHQRQQGEASTAQQARTMEAIQESILRLTSAQEDSLSRAHEVAHSVSERISGAAEGAMKSSHDSVQAAKELLASIGRVSIDAINGLEQGAGRIAAVLTSVEDVTHRLSHTGTALAGLHEKSAETTRSLERASGAFGSGAQSITQALASMDKTSDRLEGVAGIVANEAQLREATLQRVQEVMHHSTKASEQFTQLSRDVESHLASGVNQFGEATVNVLNDVLKKYDDSLGGSVSLLKDTMEDLAMLVDSINGKLRN
jgi:putative membrane protein